MTKKMLLASAILSTGLGYLLYSKWRKSNSNQQSEGEGDMKMERAKKNRHVGNFPKPATLAG
ncbi:MAG: hypothetical protein V4556_04920 [Bacteroidota bacterium]